MALCIKIKPKVLTISTKGFFMNAIKDKKIADKMFELAKSWEEQTEVQWCFNNWSWSQLEKEKKTLLEVVERCKKRYPKLDSLYYRAKKEVEGTENE